MKYITIGKCTKYNIYLLISFLCEFFEEFILGLNNSNKKKPVRIFPFKEKIKNHNLLENLLRIISIFLEELFYISLKRKIKEKIKIMKLLLKKLIVSQIPHLTIKKNQHLLILL